MLKQFYATGDFKYNHRMMRAGDPVQMDGPTSRLYMHLGKISEAKPQAAKAAEKPKAPRKRTKKK